MLHDIMARYLAHSHMVIYTHQQISNTVRELRICSSNWFCWSMTYFQNIPKTFFIRCSSHYKYKGYFSCITTVWYANCLLDQSCWSMTLPNCFENLFFRSRCTWKEMRYCWCMTTALYSSCLSDWSCIELRSAAGLCSYSLFLFLDVIELYPPVFLSVRKQWTFRESKHLSVKLDSILYGQ